MKIKSIYTCQVFSANNVFNLQWLYYHRLHGVTIGVKCAPKYVGHSLCNPHIV